MRAAAAAASAVRVPRCFASLAPTGRRTGGLLILEALRGESADARAGCTPAQARAAVRALACFHASSWGATAGGGGALPLVTVPAQPSATREAQRRLSRDYDERWPVFARCFGARLSEDAVRAGASLRGRLHLVAAAFSAPPHAILHGDARVANFLFVGDSDGDGGGDGDGGAALVDFEAVGVGRPADLAAFVRVPRDGRAPHARGRAAAHVPRAARRAASRATLTRSSPTTRRWRSA